MTPELWIKVESLFHKVLEAEEGRRGTVLEESCAGDEDLRREVESLLAQHKTDGSFIEKPAFEPGGTFRTPVVPAAAIRRPSLVGHLFGRYRIEEEIGFGGMGVVYKAWDSKMEAWVALKSLSRELAADRHAVERLRREARSAFGLNHPNICTIYDIVEEQGSVFIAMEYLEGQTLAGYIGGRALSADRIPKIGMAIAEALGAAHAKGVIHRDVKPGNIFLTTTAQVKVLDFGVAKLVQAPGGDPTAATISLTKTDGVSGTLPYMSPEQLRGQNVDARSDIYALGLVLYEMSTGRRPYTGNREAELVDAILNRPAPPPKNINPLLPIKLEEIILKCLEKEPEDRYQTAKEIAVDLRRGSKQSDTAIQAVTKKTTRKGRVVLFGAAGAVCLGFAAWWFWPVPPPRVTGSTTITHDGWQKCCIVTDGSRVYFDQFPHGNPVLAQVSAAGGESSVIETPIPDPLILDISPDHSGLLVRSNDDNDTPFWILPLPAGSPRPLGNLVGHEAKLSRDGRQIVFIKGSDLYLSRTDGGEPRLLKSGNVSFPYFSPDGSRVRFTVTWPGTLWEIDTNGSNLHQLLPGWNNTANRCCGRWTSDGRYYAFWSDALSEGDFFALREARGFFHRASAVPFQLTFGPLHFDFGVLFPSADGRKLFVQGRQDRSELVRYDAGSKQFLPVLTGVSATAAAFSRDGKWIAYVVPDGTLWRSRLDGSERLQLTFAPARSSMPSWSPNGTRIAYTDQLLGKARKVFLVPAQGGSPEELVPGDVEQTDPTWSSDGNRLVFSRDSHGGGPDLKIVDLKTRQVTMLPASKGLFSPRWSPDGRYLAAFTIDIKKLVLYDFKAQEWSDWVIDPGGMSYPSWTGDSRYLYYDHGNLESKFTCRRVMVGVNHPENIFGLSELQRYDGWAGQAPDNSRLLNRDLTTTDIYALDVDFP